MRSNVWKGFVVSNFVFVFFAEEVVKVKLLHGRAWLNVL